jgi:hypothetical protein
MMWSDMFFRFAGKGIKGYYDYHPDSGEYYEYDVDSMYQSSESVEEYTE